MLKESMDHKLFLLTAEQMRQVDARAIERLGGGYGLMQQAGKRVCAEVMRLMEAVKFPPKILILCGNGNNGGDGFVAANCFLEEDIPVQVCLLGEMSTMRETAEQAYDELPKTCLIAPEEIQWSDYTIIVDALFGIGLDRDIEGLYRDVIQQANQANALRIAVDIPSGIHTDSGKILGIAFKADVTVTFFAPKPGHYLLPGKAYCGEVAVADIGIEPQDVEEDELTYFLNHPQQWEGQLVQPSIDQHKYHRGHSLIVSGDMEHMGASKLAAVAALRAGSGLVSIACDDMELLVYAAWASSVMTKSYTEESDLIAILQEPKITTIAYGMGAGRTDETRARVKAILQTGKPCVLDADALSSFAGCLEELQPLLHSQVVLTPHEGEFWRLFSGHIAKDVGRLQMALQAASLTGAIIVLKGNDTIIAEPNGRAYINHTAPLHLATAGSGDVLAGIITGQLAQGVPPFEAAASGVWKHSQAANRYGKGMIADDLIAGLLQRA